MKISKILLSALVILLFSSVAMFADRMDRADKREARRVLKRTAGVLMVAQNTVKKNKVYTGNLVRAYRHQQFARELYESREFERAIRQSLRARNLAYQAIRANKQKYNEDFDRDERRFSKDMKDDDLDRDFDRRKPPAREKDMKDDDVVNLHIEADIK